MLTTGWFLVTIVNPAKGEEALLTSMCNSEVEVTDFVDKFWGGEKVIIDTLPGSFERVS